MLEETTDQHRPRMAEGTTDWEAVFENAKTGFIPLIAQAHSSGVLQECANLVILKLFPRQNDSHEVEHFTTELAKIIPDGVTEDRMAELRDGVTVLLREIKEERIHLAAKYVARKRKGKGAEKERRGAKPKRSRKGKSSAAAWAGRAATVVLAVVGFTYLVSLSERSTELAPASELVAQMELAAKNGKASGRHVYGGTLKTQMINGNVIIAAVAVPQEPCVNAAWMLAHSGRVAINGTLPPRITPVILAELCGRVTQASSGGGYSGNGSGESPTGGVSPANIVSTLTWFTTNATKGVK